MQSSASNSNDATLHMSRAHCQWPACVSVRLCAHRAMPNAQGHWLKSRSLPCRSMRSFLETSSYPARIPRSVYDMSTSVYSDRSIKWHSLFLVGVFCNKLRTYEHNLETDNLGQKQLNLQQLASNLPMLIISLPVAHMRGTAFV